MKYERTHFILKCSCHIHEVFTLMFHMLMLIFAYFLAFILLSVSLLPSFITNWKDTITKKALKIQSIPKAHWVFATLPLNHKLFLTAWREKSIHKQTTTTKVHSLHCVILRRQVFNPWTISNDHLSWSTSTSSYSKNCSMCESPRYVSPSQNTQTK